MITQDDIIYFVFTDRFYDGDTSNNFDVDKTNPVKFHGGDFAGLIQKAPYLKELGITAVWISPVYINIANFNDADAYHYYWAIDFSKIDKHLYTLNPNYAEGSKEYLRDLVTELKKYGIKVILDMIVNHAGYTADNYYPKTWFQDGDSVEEDPLCGLPDFDHDNPNVVDFFINNIMDWIEETGIEGIRMDTAKHVEGRFWNYYKAQIKGKFPTMTIIGEVLYEAKDDENSKVIDEVSKIARFQSEYDFDSTFDFPLRTAIVKTIIKDYPMTRLARPRLFNNEEKGILDLDNIRTGGYTNVNMLVTLLDNHDLDKRIMSLSREKHSGEENKALAFQITKLCLALQFTSRGIPQLYYGAELGLEGWRQGPREDDFDLRRDFPWELIDEKTNLPKKVNGKETLEGELFYYTQSLIKLKKDNDALKFGNTITLWVDKYVYAYIRFCRNNIVFCVINNGYHDMASELNVPIIVFPEEQKWRQMLPDRIIGLMRENYLKEWFNPNDKIKLEVDSLKVLVKGKSIKIYYL